MAIIKEFKDFAMKGNLVDMAVAFILGAAFSKLVSAFIQGMVMPLIGMATSGVNFADLKWVLSPAVLNEAGELLTPEVAVLYGAFITVIIDFLLVAMVMFILVKNINRMKKKKEAAPAPVAPPAPTKEEILLGEIRDLLKK
jgi:large conductance mechanosensitive channel